MDGRREVLRQRLLGLGFDEVRFVRLDPSLEAGGLREWLNAGFHADMEWMQRTAEKRLDPGLVVPGARSAVVLGVNYLGDGPPSGAGATWARYSLYGDYHDSLKSALVAGGRALEEVFGAGPEDYRYYVDTGPVMERGWAARAGVGFIGKNAMLISRSHGNWLLLASLLTTLELESDPPVSQREHPGRVGLLCGKCTRCLDACPTQAFPEPGVVDSRRCISYQTIENRGFIPREFRAAIGDRIYGCDVCLEVCPWNRFARAGRRVLLSARGDIEEMGLRDLLGLSREDFSRVFRGTAIKRVKWTGLLRNACVVAGNSGDPSLREPLLALASHESAVVRGHAVWAIRRLGGDARLVALEGCEHDLSVLEEYHACVRVGLTGA